MQTLVDKIKRKPEPETPPEPETKVACVVCGDDLKRWQWPQDLRDPGLCDVHARELSQ